MYTLMKYPSLCFWLIIILTLFTIVNIRRLRAASKWWKWKLIFRGCLWGLFWCPLTLTWSYSNLSAGTGHAMAIGKAGFGSYLAAKGVIKKYEKNTLTAINKQADKYTPRYGKRIGKKICGTIAPTVSLTQEVSHDVGLQPTKPKLPLGQRVWRGACGIVSGAVKAIGGIFVKYN